MAMTPDQLRRITGPVKLPLIPQLKACGIPADADFDAFRTRYAGIIGAGVPYWAVSWPGGQALARFLLDQPEIVAGRRVIDIGCGNGLVACAAMRAGAQSAMAIDYDPNALLAAAETARLNGVDVETRAEPLETLEAPAGTVICAGDLWYERETGRRATSALMRLADAGAVVLAGDPGRPGRPRRGAVEVARYQVPVSLQFEAAPTVVGRVFAIGVDAILPAHYPNALNKGRGGVAFGQVGNYGCDDGLS